ncbi:MAG TPA: NAD+ synthase [Methanocella sp.]|uniref:NAD+ synthase n=1 Tax=Methanocella sp. TaxID=2052833 RepID=UPI002CCF88FF|nr:NAD+ synthase [Methanocella sp.]HTY91821.1 NAD+ synthase [Methanocella sp.]
MKGLLLSRDELVKCENEIEESIVRVVETSKTSGAVVALSGGIDSALVAILAARVVDVYGLLLPDTTSNSPQDVEDAQGLARSLGIDYELIEIDPIVEAVYASRPRLGPKKCKLAYANVKPRVRMIMNYFASNLDGRIVLGTGNKTELLMGYFTKYGDGGVDILPIGGLYKTRVRQMAKHVGVPDDIIKKPPSAGLWKGQTDEGEMGITYEALDKILYGVFDLGLSYGEIQKETGVDEAAFAHIMERVRDNEHKRNMPPTTDIGAILGR